MGRLHFSPQGLIRVMLFHVISDDNVNLGVKCCQECDLSISCGEDQFKCGMTKNVSSSLSTPS